MFISLILQSSAIIKPRSGVITIATQDKQDSKKSQNQQNRSEGGFIKPDDRVNQPQSKARGEGDDVYNPNQRDGTEENPDLMRLQELHNARDRGMLVGNDEQELKDLEAQVKKTQTEDNPNKVDLRPDPNVPKEYR